MRLVLKEGNREGAITPGIRSEVQVRSD